jgi:murein DD-endopeptidase MepM/ murein hydrolase activator NlpD
MTNAAAAGQQRLLTVVAVSACVSIACAAVGLGGWHAAAASGLSAATSDTTTTSIVVSAPKVETLVVARAATVTKPAKRLRQTGLLPFPMNPLPKCTVLDNFGDPRGSNRRHQGIDILASLGQDVFAVADGTLTIRYVDGAADAQLSGNAWTLTQADKTYYFYAHLSAFADGLSVGSKVTKGQLIGYVGDTGDPGPGNYHLHFEVHPGGGAAINGLPLIEIPSTCVVY